MTSPEAALPNRIFRPQAAYVHFPHCVLPHLTVNLRFSSQPGLALPHFFFAPLQSIQEVSSCLIENTVNTDTRIAINAVKASRSNLRARAET